MRIFSWILVGLAVLMGSSLAGAAEDTWQQREREFREPPRERQSRPLWFWNGPPSAEETARQMEGLAKVGYAGVAILPGGGKDNRGPGCAFMSPEYIKQYLAAADTAKRLGMKLCLYDEYWFPSGSAGGLLAQRHPEALGKRLDRTVWDVKGPARFERKVDLPEHSRLMGVVAVADGGKHRVDVTRNVADGLLRWDAPEGDWRVQVFVCVPDGARGLVDYLDAESVGKFYDLTYEAYRKALGEHFGTTIDSAFYDEPTFHWIGGGRAWTPGFNDAFGSRFGVSPVTLYPALWEDIGPDTAAARNALFGFRATLFSEGFIKTIAERLARHGVPLTGHVDQEEIVNPVGLCGDLMKALEHQPIPGLDQIFKYGRGSKMYKVVSSAANNYDRSLVMTEVYGAEGRIPIDVLYREAMDQAAKGVNLFVPHAVWYDASPGQVTFEPELSHRDPLYGPALPAYNQYIGRLQGLLQAPGRHVADIAIIYPIASLQAAYHFDGPLKPYDGGIVPEEAEYMDVGERFSLELRRDYTFLHPDVVQKKCRVEADRLVLENTINREEYRVVIVPGMRAINLPTLETLAEFYRRGGRIIATTRLADQAAELGKNEDVRLLIRELFGPAVNGATPPAPNTNAAGGKAWFLRSPDAKSLDRVLKEAVPVADAAFDPQPDTAGAVGNFSYLHRVIDGRNVWFFANSSDRPIETTVRLRGQHDKLAWWDPHDGAIRSAEVKIAADGATTTVPLRLPPVRSVFLISETPRPNCAPPRAEVRQ